MMGGLMKLNLSLVNRLYDGIASNSHSFDT